MTDLLQRDLDYGVTAEKEVAAIIARAWKCEVRETPLRAFYDFDLDRNGRTEAIVEVKTRRFESSKYADTFLPFEKWYRLIDISRALDVRGFFVANFTDEIRWIEVGDIDSSRHRVCGRTDRPNMPHDISTKILVPVKQMKTLAALDQVAA